MSAAAACHSGFKYAAGAAVVAVVVVVAVDVLCLGGALLVRSVGGPACKAWWFMLGERTAREALLDELEMLAKRPGDAQQREAHFIRTQVGRPVAKVTGPEPSRGEREERERARHRSFFSSLAQERPLAFSFSGLTCSYFKLLLNSDSTASSSAQCPPTRLCWLWLSYLLALDLLRSHTLCCCKVLQQHKKESWP